MVKPDIDINNAPSYLVNLIESPVDGSFAELLFYGSCCGHGEELYRVYEIVNKRNRKFLLKLPDLDINETFPIAVKAIDKEANEEFLVYNSRLHPASWYSMEKFEGIEPIYRQLHECNRCGKTEFYLAVGFEISSDSETNNDVSWFSLATECVSCGKREITFDDETA